LISEEEFNCFSEVIWMMFVLMVEIFYDVAPKDGSLNRGVYKILIIESE